MRTNVVQDCLMNSPLHPEVLLLRSADGQAELTLGTEGVLRYVWEGRFGAMLIEVIDQRVYVNGEVVDRSGVQPSDVEGGT
jgi:hypothetical protein